MTTNYAESINRPTQKGKIIQGERKRFTFSVAKKQAFFHNVEYTASESLMNTNYKYANYKIYPP